MHWNIWCKYKSHFFLLWHHLLSLISISKCPWLILYGWKCHFNFFPVSHTIALYFTTLELLNIFLDLNLHQFLRLIILIASLGINRMWAWGTHSRVFWKMSTSSPNNCVEIQSTGFGFEILATYSFLNHVLLLIIVVYFGTLFSLKCFRMSDNYIQSIQCT